MCSWRPARTPVHSTGQSNLALLVFVPGFAGPLFRALGQTVLSSVCAVIVIGSYWTITFFLLFAYTPESVFGLLYVSIFFVPALGFAIAATISLARRLRVEWAFSTVGVGFLRGDRSSDVAGGEE